MNGCDAATQLASVLSPLPATERGEAGRGATVITMPIV